MTGLAYVSGAVNKQFVISTFCKSQAGPLLPITSVPSARSLFNRFCHYHVSMSTVLEARGAMAYGTHRKEPRIFRRCPARLKRFPTRVCFSRWWVDESLRLNIDFSGTRVHGDMASHVLKREIYRLKLPLIS